jgi:hypothetical protein
MERLPASRGVTGCPYRSMHALDELEDRRRSVLPGADRRPGEVDLAQDEGDNWKLGYVQTPDKDWTVDATLRRLSAVGAPVTRRRRG